MQMVGRYTERCSTTRRDCLTPCTIIVMFLFLRDKRLKIYPENEPLHVIVGIANCQNNIKFPQKIKIELPHEQGNHTSGHTSKGFGIRILKRHLHSRGHCNTIRGSQDDKAPKCLTGYVRPCHIRTENVSPFKRRNLCRLRQHKYTWWTH